MKKGLTYLILISSFFIAAFFALPEATMAQGWSGNCSLTMPCPGLIYGDGRFDIEGFHPTSAEGHAFFSSKDAGLANLDVAQGRLAFDVKGLNVETIPENSLYFAHIHRMPWNGCKDDFWFTMKLTGQDPLGTVGSDIWAQGFDFSVKNFGVRQQGYPGDWHHVEINWDNTGWTATIDGVGSVRGELVYDLVPRVEEIMIGVGAEINEERNPVSEPENIPPWGFGLYDVSGQGGIDVAYRNLEWNFSSGDTHNPNAKDSEFCEENPLDDPLNPYDTCSCHGIPNIEEEACEDTVNKGDKEKPNYLRNFPFGFDGGVMDWYWTLKDMEKEMNTKNEQTSADPDILIEIAPPAAQEGEIVTAIAAPMQYRSRMTNMYISWCRVDNDVAYPMNTIVAGGQAMPELTQPDLTWEEKGCCQPLTRIPEVDTDNDGMDDNWEMEKFVGRGDGQYQSIQDVLPNADPDADGYYADRFRNENDQIMTATPYFIDALGNIYPTGEESALWTNIEEYIADTDPMNGDTDGDGYADEMDFIGVGQMQYQFTIDKPAGPNGFYDISASVVGVNQSKKIGLAADKKRMFIGTGESMQVALRASSGVMTLDDSVPLNINVVVGGSDESQNNLDYQWFFNGESVCDDLFPELCDVGQSSLILGEGGISFLDLPPVNSTEYTFKVVVTSPATRTQGEASLTLPMSNLAMLSTIGCHGQTEEITTVPANGEIPVYVCLAEIAEFTELGLGNLNFIWAKDGITDNEQSGLGKTDYALLATEPAGESHTLSLRVKDANNAKELLGAEQVFEIEGPTVEIIEPESSFEYSDSETPENSRYVVVGVGDEITFQAEFRNFSTVSGFNIAWQVDGEDIQGGYVPENIDSFTFGVPEDAIAGDEYNLILMVSSADINHPEEDLDSINVLVGEAGSQLGQNKPFFETLAAAFMQVPDIFVGVMKYAAILAGVFFLLIFIYPKFARYSNRK